MLGQKILSLRLKKGLSIREVAERSGVSVVKLIEAENNQYILAEDEITAVAQGFGVSVKEFCEMNQEVPATNAMVTINVLAENNVFAEGLEEFCQMELFLDVMNTQIGINDYLNSAQFSEVKKETISRQGLSVINEKLRESGYYEV